MASRILLMGLVLDYMSPMVRAKEPHWAVAILLTTQPSQKSDGWTARSVKRSEGDSECPSGATLCAVLVLHWTFSRYSGLDQREADFVALVDGPSLECDSLAANGILCISIDFEGKKVFADYLLMRKFYVLKLTQYEKVLLLDSDTIVVGSLRHIFEHDASCGQVLSDECWPETDHSLICTPAEKKPLVLAQQTAGTPILTAFMLVHPDRQAWLELADALELACGGSIVCSRQYIYRYGWNRTRVTKPHEWALRSSFQNRRLSHRKTKLSWQAMGAGFTDQGFAEFYFGQQLHSLYSISHRTCKIKYLHFNFPPKPWFCPGPHCVDQNAAFRKNRRRSSQATLGDLRWGGHKCATDWWHQFVLAQPHLITPAGSCAEHCRHHLEKIQADRATFTDATMRNYTPCAKDWNPRWPRLPQETRPDAPPYIILPAT